MTSDEWQPMNTFPKDGTHCDIKTEHAIAKNIWWGQEPLGKNYVLRGDENKLSEYVIERAVGWHKTPEDYRKGKYYDPR